MSLPQLIGLKCVACQRSIDSVVEGGFCDACGNPVHRRCVGKPEPPPADRCPQCGGAPANAIAQEVRREREAAVPAKRGGSAENPVSQVGAMFKIRLLDLTLVGWLLTLVTIGLTILLMFFSGRLWHDLLPPGQYPRLVLAAPGLLIAIGFFVAGKMVLDAKGFPVLRRAAEHEVLLRPDYAAAIQAQRDHPFVRRHFFQVMSLNLQMPNQSVVPSPVALEFRAGRQAALIWQDASGKWFAGPWLALGQTDADLSGVPLGVSLQNLEGGTAHRSLVDALAALETGLPAQ